MKFTFILPFKTLNNLVVSKYFEDKMVPIYRYLWDFFPTNLIKPSDLNQVYSNLEFIMKRNTTNLPF